MYLVRYILFYINRSNAFIPTLRSMKVFSHSHLYVKQRHDVFCLKVYPQSTAGAVFIFSQFLSVFIYPETDNVFFFFSFCLPSIPQECLTIGVYVMMCNLIFTLIHFITSVCSETHDTHMLFFMPQLSIKRLSTFRITFCSANNC